MKHLPAGIVAGLLWALTSPVWAAPVVSIPQSEYNFGKILQGETVHHRFVFSNNGDAPLRVEKVSSSCGCTAALASAKVLAPGESGEIQTSFDSARFQGDIGKTVYLYTNDPAKPMTQLQLKGSVHAEIALEPQLINFGVVASKRTVSATVTLVNQGAHELRLEKPETTAAELAVSLSESLVPPRGKATLKLSLTPKPGQTRFSGYVLFKAAGALQHDLRIPVYADIGERAASLH